MRVTFRNRCPYCDSSYIFRIPRKFYMRISPLVKHYECDLCMKRLPKCIRKEYSIELLENYCILNLL